MSWTNAVAAKKAIIDTLQTLPALADVAVTYGYEGNEDMRELVHGGRAEGTQSHPVAGGGSVRFKRDEHLVVKLHVMVEQPGWSRYEVEVRATVIGGVIEEWVAGVKETLPGMNGQLISIGTATVGIDSDLTDDGAIAVLDFDVEVFSRLS